MTRKPQLSDLQLAIMRVLWKRREASAADVQAALAADRELAPTTVSTMLSRLERRGLVSHRTEGRQFVYAPRVPEDAVMQADVEDLTRRWFEGDPAALVSHLLDEREISPGDLERVRALISARMDEERRGGRT